MLWVGVEAPICRKFTVKLNGDFIPDLAAPGSGRATPDLDYLPKKSEDRG
jgi:hypothetical protein